MIHGQQRCQFDHGEATYFYVNILDFLIALSQIMVTT